MSSKNNGSRINQVKEQGNFIILNLSCGHSIKQRVGWWSKHCYGVRHIHCPNCKGFKE